MWQRATPKLYERLPGEGDGAWHAFQAYRDLGHQRSLRKVTEQIAQEEANPGGDATNGNNLPQVLTVVYEGSERASKGHRKETSGRVHKWSVTHRWVERATAWDEFVDTAVRKASLNKTLAMHKRQQDVASAGHLLTSFPITWFLNRFRMKEEERRLQEIPIEDLLGLGMEAAYRLHRVQDMERRAHGVIVTDTSGAGVGPFIWELHKRKPERPPDELAEAEDGAEDEDDPWDRITG